MFDKLKDAISGGGSAPESEALGGYAQYVKDVQFPVSKSELLDHLQTNGATEALIEHVRSMSRDHFDSAEDVFATLFPH
ncbi:MAG: DUF2795 domain-containing protein [Thermomicrobiales bacterium]